MNAKKIILFLFWGILLQSCTKKCSTLKHYPIAPAIESYFGNYVIGNSWKYATSDGLKEDSVYVISCEYPKAMDTKDLCESYQGKTCKVHSTYFASDSIAELIVGMFGAYGKFGSSLDLQDNQLSPDIEISIRSFYDSDTIIYSDSFFQGSYPITWVNSFSDTRILNGQLFNSVLLQKGNVIASKYGIIQFVSPISKDTFFLQKFKLQ